MVHLLCEERRGRLVLRYSQAARPGVQEELSDLIRAMLRSFTRSWCGKFAPFIWRYFREYWTMRTSLYKPRTSPPPRQRLQMRRTAFRLWSAHKQTPPQIAPRLSSLFHCLLEKRAKSQKAPWRRYRWRCHSLLSVLGHSLGDSLCLSIWAYSQSTNQHLFPPIHLTYQ